VFHRLTVSCDQFLGFWRFEFRHETFVLYVFMFFFLAPSNLLGTAVYGMTRASSRMAKTSRILSVLSANQDSYVRPTQSLIRSLVPTCENGPYYLAFFPFFLGIFPSRESASAWPSRFTCSNNLVLLSNFSPQTLHAQLLFDSPSRAFFTASRALRFSRFDISTFVDFAAPTSSSPSRSSY